MIIQSLCKYYEILAKDDGCNISRTGYGITRVSAVLIISLQGELVDVISLQVVSESGKKFVSKNMKVPEQAKRQGISAPSYFMCDNIQYVLGFDKNKNIKEKQFESFKDNHNRILEYATGKRAKAVLNFVNRWNINNALTNPLIKNNYNLLLGGNLVFRLDGDFEFAHEDIEIKSLWEQKNLIGDNEVIQQCLVTGEKLRISRIHNSIKPLFIPKGKQPSPNGWTLVAVDKDSTAYDSYSKKQSYNSPISEKSVFAYTTVLNYMLSNQKQKVQIGDATTVFWAECPDEIYTDLAAELLNPCINQDFETSTGHRRDKKIEATIKEVLLNAKLGNRTNKSLNEEINPLTKFYVLGLSPNASRISIRFFQSDNFGGFVDKIVQHYKDMEIIKDFDNRPDNIPIWMLIKETISPKSTDKDAKPLLAGSIMRSILCGGMYSQSLYNSILQRVKADGEIRVNYVRASIVKAFLIRRGRITKNKIFEEVSTVALNEQTTEKAYLLGRLFAILEKTQNDAGNVTIRAKYFASAMTTPGAVFPILLRLAQHHISKAEYGFLNDKKIESIIQNIDSFPSHLTLDQQGIFILGYYHQRSKLWEKQVKEIQNTKEEN